MSLARMTQFRRGFEYGNMVVGRGMPGFAGLGSLGQQPLPANYKTWANYDAFLYNVGVQQGGTSLGQIRAYILDRIQFGISKYATQAARIAEIDDPALKQALTIQYQDGNKYTPTYQRILADGGSTITDATVRGVFGGLNSWMTKLDKLINAIQVIPGTVGLAMSASEIADEAYAQMTPQEKAVMDSPEGGVYQAQLKQQIFSNKLIDIMKSFLDPVAVAPLEQQADSNAQALKQAEGQLGVQIDKMSDNNPALAKALDEAETGGFFALIKKPFDISGAMFGSLPPQWKWVAGIAAVGGALWLSRPLFGFLSNITRRRRPGSSPA